MNVICKSICLEITSLLGTYSLGFGNKNNSCIRETQENSIEFQVQSSLPYILIPMVHANYCAPYPK